MEDRLFSKIQKAIVELDKENLAKLTEQAVRQGVNPVEAIEKAYTVGIQKVGYLFGVGELFLPELVYAGKMVQTEIAKMEKLIPEGKVARKGKIVLGTVEGDIHDIGKNLVSVMLSANGIEVIDIGIDCPVDKFIDRAMEENADLIGASCLLTTTSPELKKLIERMKERGVRERFPVIVGGAVITREWAVSIGADGFGKDLKEAPYVALSILQSGKGGHS